MVMRMKYKVRYVQDTIVIFSTVLVDQQVFYHPDARQQTFVTLGTLISRFMRR